MEPKSPRPSKCKSFLLDQLLRLLPVCFLYFPKPSPTQPLYSYVPPYSRKNPTLTAKIDQPNVGGELAPGLADLSSNTEFDDKKAPTGEVKDKKKMEEEQKEEEEKQSHQVEIKGASERQPESADSL